MTPDTAQNLKPIATLEESSSRRPGPRDLDLKLREPACSSPARYVEEGGSACGGGDFFRARAAFSH